MKIETLLPLGKVDPGLRTPDSALDIHAVGRDAQLIEALGYDGFVVEETKVDPYIVVALAAQATSTLGLGTAVAIAFPRSPTITAMSAWIIQRLSRGRFTLGLGPQVKGHIERRFGLQWSPVATWMREYVQAVRTVWDCWQNGTPLDFQGDHYRLNLMLPMFNPGPIESPAIPIHLAAVNPAMCRVAGELADGVRPHPVCTPSYIKEVMLPAVRAGAAKSGRSLHDFAVAMKPLVAAAPDEDLLEVKVRDARARLSFYATTPSYLPAFEHMGLSDLANEARVLSKAQRWEELPRLISDDVLHQFVIVGTYDKIGRKLLERFGPVVTQCEFSIAVRNETDRQTLASLVRDIRAASTDQARATIVGAAL